ncbi:MAG: NAD(P)H-dependent oxidoreductase subunit E [Sphingomonadales bacterium]|nr:NAD(P)H-dependent oxidoreductase subunit E [Sphingomonadales bacterium]
MADRHLEPVTDALRARWDGFQFNAAWDAKAKAAIARYPAGRQRSAVMALLDYAQRQVGEETQTQGWLPIPVMEYVARYLDMPVVRVVEVATFYTMYNLVPVGRYHVQVCGTTPCMLRGSDDLIAACAKRGMEAGHVSADGLWSFTEVECMGNCASAPMVQINDDNYEDLTAERLDHILDELAAGRQPKTGTQEPGRHTVEPVGALSTLTAMATENHDYRGEW